MYDYKNKATYRNLHIVKIRVIKCFFFAATLWEWLYLRNFCIFIQKCKWNQMKKEKRFYQRCNQKTKCQRQLNNDLMRIQWEYDHDQDQRDLKKLLIFHHMKILQLVFRSQPKASVMAPNFKEMYICSILKRYFFDCRKKIFLPRSILKCLLLLKSHTVHNFFTELKHEFPDKRLRVTHIFLLRHTINRAEIHTLSHLSNSGLAIINIS